MKNIAVQIAYNIEWPEIINDLLPKELENVIQDVKRTVFINLDEKEWDEYMWFTWSDRESYIEQKAREIFNN